MKTDLEKLLRTADAESLAPALNAVKPQKLDKETKAALAAAVSPTVKTKAPAETKGVKKPAFNFLKPVAVIALCALCPVLDDGQRLAVACAQLHPHSVVACCLCVGDGHGGADGLA